MKKLYLNSISIIITLIVILFACKKTENYFRAPGAGGTLTSSIAGRVTDLNNLPINNALVSVGTITAKTNSDGQFFINNVGLNNDLGFVSISKAGYFTGSRTFFVNHNSINTANTFSDPGRPSHHTNIIYHVNIKLIPKNISGAFASSSGGTINVWGGGTVVINAGSIVNATTGSTYNGNVSVSTFYLNPADIRINEYMPGDLLGITVNNERRILQSFGMIAIEMNDASGQKLQLAHGKTATINIPIPPNLQATAPASIPLWYFDEDKGLWKEDGIARRQGNIYTGTVSHFSFWNCDLPAKYVKLDVTFKDRKGIPLANHLVTITSIVYGTRGGYTDNEGTVSGLIPANETLVLKVFDQCHEIIYTSNIGPFSGDVNLGNIIITTSPGQPNITVSGNAVDCNNIAVTNGYVMVNNGTNYFSAPLNKGNFTITFPVCTGMNNLIKLYIIDDGNSRQSEVQIININNGNQNIGQITACIDFFNL